MHPFELLALKQLVCLLDGMLQMLVQAAASFPSLPSRELGKVSNRALKEMGAEEFTAAAERVVASCLNESVGWLQDLLQDSFFIIPSRASLLIGALQDYRNSDFASCCLKLIPGLIEHGVRFIFCLSNIDISDACGDSMMMAQTDAYYSTLDGCVTIYFKY